MTEFEPVGLEHRSLFAAAHAAEPSGSSGDSFGCVYLWDQSCRRNIADLGGRVGVEFMCPRGIFYTFPFGRGPLAPAIEALSERAASHGRPLELRGLTPAQRSVMETTFSGGFDYFDDRDNYDYICETDAVASLAGKKLHGKRNFCNRFEKTFSWTFEQISPANLDACLALQDEWIQERGNENPEEDAAIRRMFCEWEQLGMLGGLLIADGKPVGFTAAERIAPDMADVHFEKALVGYPGAYPMVAREFARLVKVLLPEVRYLNREEDMGLPNLRKAKEEWHPAFLLEKTTAVRRAED